MTDPRDGDLLTPVTDAAERARRARLRQDADQADASADQAHSASDQSGSDADQRTSDAEQALADRDQHASDRDQAAADWERTHSGDGMLAEHAHETSRLERDAVTRERETVTERRAAAAAQRLTTAALRDEMARSRDLTAEARDRAARARDDAADGEAARAAEQVRSATAAGDLATIDEQLGALRLASAVARRHAEHEREQAANDREAAARDREVSAAERHLAGIDELTGIFERGTGELALAHEMERARRAEIPLVVAMFDVAELRAVAHPEGRAAVYPLVRDVAAAITGALRVYDVTVRWGDDEFVSAIADVTATVAEQRLGEIRQALDRRRPGVSISAGQTQLQERDTLESLVTRAGAALSREKAQHASADAPSAFDEAG
ncbi:MAG TPA: diguanylate cyclase [Conexibacter sp.]|nr:diguanylate cyclase [Conexibacter sp.]